MIFTPSPKRDSKTLRPTGSAGNCAKPGAAETSNATAAERRVGSIARLSILRLQESEAHQGLCMRPTVPLMPMVSKLVFILASRVIGFAIRRCCAIQSWRWLGYIQSGSVELWLTTSGRWKGSSPSTKSRRERGVVVARGSTSRASSSCCSDGIP